VSGSAKIPLWHIDAVGVRSLPEHLPRAFIANPPSPLLLGAWFARQGCVHSIYRAKGRTRYKTMTLAAAEFIRRFLLHVLPTGFHRIRHYGLLANAGRKDNLARARELLNQPAPEPDQPVAASPAPTFVCRHCGAPMIVIDILPRPRHIRAPPAPP
jgi:hypothetical protein